MKAAPPAAIHPTAAGKADSAAKPVPYHELLPATASTERGLFTVHKVRSRYYFEIPDSLLDADLLLVNRIGQAAGGIRPVKGMLGYAGDELGEHVIRFTRGPGNKLFIRQISFRERSNDTTQNGMYRSVHNSNLQPIVAAFDIKAFSPDSAGVVIDMTDFLNGDNGVLFFDSEAKKIYGLAALQTDKSYTDRIRSFPQNVEVKTVKTYLRTEQSYATYQLNSSFVVLPKQPMQPRYQDPRVGYFAALYTDFDKPQGWKTTAMITRWRLEPRPQDMDRYLRGDLVEPQKPIVFYIDPATPAKWVPYLIEGIDDWQAAFRQAGFKHAIYALPAPTGDSTWSLDDARHSAIVYKPSPVENASGVHVHDPRTGEILESHINWYHNVMQLAHDWYMIQAGPNDTGARKMIFSDSLMGRLIRFIVSHEIGHTLGLAHNFGASSTVPVDSLRSRTWVEKYGFCPSIMDYARFNYVAQPQDGMSREDIMPHIGEYDRWAIEWGYRWIPALQHATQDEEKAYMNHWIIRETARNPRLFFGAQNSPDPRNQSEDLGDDPMKAGYYGILNLKRVLASLIDWTREANSDYQDLFDMEQKTAAQYLQYLAHVAALIGGIEHNSLTVEEKGRGLIFVPRQRQREAVRFLDEQLFRSPRWLLDTAAFMKIGGTGAYNISDFQNKVLGLVVSQQTFTNLYWFQTNRPDSAYTFNQLLDDLEQDIFSELSTTAPVDIYRRSLQKIYLDRLVACLHFRQSPNPVDQFYGPSNAVMDMPSIIRGHLRRLAGRLGRAQSHYQDAETAWHLADLQDRIKKALDPDASPER